MIFNFPLLSVPYLNRLITESMLYALVLTSSTAAPLFEVEQIL